MFGFNRRRNQPVDVEAVNPKSTVEGPWDSGNAGLDGCTVISRADRDTGLRPSIGGTPTSQGPRYNQEQ